MKLVFLGTSAAQPTTNRGLSCICLVKDGEILMFDAGESAQTAFLKSGLGWNKPMKIFVTHLHGDHCVGILGLLQTMSMQKRTKDLEIYGPPGTLEFITANIKMLNFALPFTVRISVVREGSVCDSELYSIEACKAGHSIMAFSYLFREKDRPGRFHQEAAESLGIPEGNLWGKLQNGHNVIVNGNVITPSQVLGESRRGRKIGISGDTRPTAQLEKFFADCDYLIFDATFLEELEYRARETGHSTASQAATLAKNAGVKNLILTHFSARYADEDNHIVEAGKIHNSVTAAKDMLEIEIR